MTKMVKLSKNKEVFAEWLAIPKRFRSPRTQRELAVMLIVQRETLSRWKQEPDVQQRVFELARNKVEVTLPEILDVIVEKAKKGHIRFVKLALEMTAKHQETITVMQEVPEVGIERWKGVLEKVAQWERERWPDG